MSQMPVQVGDVIEIVDQLRGYLGCGDGLVVNAGNIAEVVGIDRIGRCIIRVADVGDVRVVLAWVKRQIVVR